jgi:hypothetical protein
VAAEHATKIYTVAAVGIVVIVAFLALTSIGHVIDAATQHFMLFYAGVFALIGLCASVGLGLVSTDRMFLNPGHRIFIQSAHRAASFGAVTFLIIHIITEILAQRVHVIDAVIPFLSPFRTFYIGLGTIASDLIILLVVTGIMRGRFNANGKAWRWRAIHYTSYASFVFGVWHGLLGGRPGKPYVDWSYGFLIAFVLLGLAVRVFSNSLRPKENLSGPAVPMTTPSASAPLRAAAMAAQLSVSRGGPLGRAGGFTGSVTGGQPVLSAPVGTPVLTATALPAGGQTDQGQPYYEPGYEGPPRYLGAPRSSGTGPMPRATGPMPRATGPMPRATGPMPAAGRGPLPPHPSGPLPRVPNSTGPMPRSGTGPMQRPPTGPMPRAGTGPQPRPGTGPMQRPATGPMPRAGTGPVPRAVTGPFPAGDLRPEPRPATGPMQRPPTGPQPQYGGGRQQSWDGPQQGWDDRQQDWDDPRHWDDGRPRNWQTGPQPRTATGPVSWPGDDPRPRGGTGPMPGAGGSRPRPGPRGGGAMPPPAGPGGGWQGGQGGPEASHDDSGWYPGEPPWDGVFHETDPDLRYREPGPGMPGYRGPRDNRYRGDR